MSEELPDSRGPAFGPSHIAELTTAWQEQAAASLQVTYTAPPTFNEYLAATRPRLSRQVQAAKDLGLIGRRRYDKAQAEYLQVVRIADRGRESQYAGWRQTAADIYLEAGGLAIMAGESDLADEWLSDPILREGAVNQADRVGLAVLAAGNAEHAKSMLLRSKPGASHAHNLLMAYRSTGDPEYRDPLILAMHDRPSLLARLARHEQRNDRQAEDIFEVAEGNWAARIAIAGVLAKSSDETVALRYGRYLNEQIDALEPPQKQWKSAGQVTWERIKRKGILEAPIEAFEIILDGMAGYGLPRGTTTPEYDRWWRETARFLALVDPHLHGRPGYSQNFARLSDTIAHNAGLPDAQLVRADWGDTKASTRVLHGEGGDAFTKFLAYRNLLHDAGPAGAMDSIGRVPKEYRRSATYYTLVSFALNGEVMRAPALPDMTDTYGPILAMYRKAADIAAGSEQSDADDEAIAQATGTTAEVSLTRLDSTDEVGFADLMARIKAIPDPAEQARQLGILLDEAQSD